MYLPNMPKVPLKIFSFRFTLANRSSENAELYLLPTIWFRNIWQWDARFSKPNLRLVDKSSLKIISASHHELGNYWLILRQPRQLLFTENETNTARIFHVPNAIPLC